MYEIIVSVLAVILIGLLVKMKHLHEQNDAKKYAIDDLYDRNYRLQREIEGLRSSIEIGEEYLGKLNQVIGIERVATEDLYKDIVFVGTLVSVIDKDTFAVEDTSGKVHNCWKISKYVMPEIPKEEVIEKF